MTPFVEEEEEGRRSVREKVVESKMKSRSSRSTIESRERERGVRVAAGASRETETGETKTEEMRGWL